MYETSQGCRNYCDQGYILIKKKNNRECVPCDEEMCHDGEKCTKDIHTYDLGNIILYYGTDNAKLREDEPYVKYHIRICNSDCKTHERFLNK